MPLALTLKNFKMKQLFFSLTLFVALFAYSQQPEKTNYFDKYQKFNKNFLIGFSVNNSWANFRDLRDSSFYRPSLGIHLSSEFYIYKGLGISADFGLQQRGMGIYTPDLDQSIGDPDSTGRLRYKVSTIEMPLLIVYRHNKDVFRNTRLSLGFGIVPMYIFKAERIWKSIDDGFHRPVSLKEKYNTFDFPLRFSLGCDFDVAGGNIFKTNFIFDYGLKGIYLNPSNNVRSNKNILLGIKLTFLF